MCSRKERRVMGIRRRGIGISREGIKVEDIRLYWLGINLSSLRSLKRRFIDRKKKPKLVRLKKKRLKL